MSLVQNQTTTGIGKGPYRVMVVDDSAVIRGLISRFLETDPLIDVVASAANGEQALRLLGQYHPEVVVLDIEMPVMDGLTALPKLLEIDPQLKIIMASTLTQRNAQISFKALSAGATDYIPKPTATREVNQNADFQRELREKVLVLGEAYRGAGGAKATPRPATAVTASGVSALRSTRPVGPAPVSLRKSLGKQAELLAIGSSTGGPQALLDLFRHLAGAIRLPILITQHMPPTFTAILAEHLSRTSGMPCAEGKEGEPVLPGRIYLAPGDWHMVVGTDGNRKVLHLNQDPPVNFCRPAVDPLFSSIAKAYDGRVLAVILTGMGQDGLNGSKEIVERGGTVIAQDEATSVVWGMPGAVATAGICSAVTSIDKLSGYIRDFPKKVVQ